MHLHQSNIRGSQSAQLPGIAGVRRLNSEQPISALLLPAAKPQAPSAARITMPKRRAAPADNSNATEPNVEQPAKRVRKAAAAETVQPFPQPISHPSHLKVAVGLQLFNCSCSGAPSISLMLSLVQVPGDVFMLGTGDCGQFGLGEDVTEALRPNPSPLPGKKVSCSQTALAVETDTCIIIKSGF